MFSNRSHESWIEFHLFASCFMIFFLVRFGLLEDASNCLFIRITNTGESNENKVFVKIVFVHLWKLFCLPVENAFRLHLSFVETVSFEVFVLAVACYWQKRATDKRGKRTHIFASSLKNVKNTQTRAKKETKKSIFNSFHHTPSDNTEFQIKFNGRCSQTICPVSFRMWTNMNRPSKNLHLSYELVLILHLIAIFSFSWIFTCSFSITLVNSGNEAWILCFISRCRHSFDSTIFNVILYERKFGFSTR